MVIRQIECGRVEGRDTIPVDALKSDVMVTANMLHILCRRISEEERVASTRHYISASLIMSKHLTVWIGEPDGSFFNIVVYLRHSSTSSGILTTDYSGILYMKNS